MTDHDSDAWETVSGWVFGCRTCLEHKVYDTQSAALARKQVHDSRALPWWVARINEKPASSAWARRAAATGGGPCPTCGKPFWTHVCLSCSPDKLSPGPGCVNCRNTGMDQTPCLPDRLTRPEAQP